MSSQLCQAPGCRRKRGRGKHNHLLATCGREECKKALAAKRKREQRAKKKAEEQIPVHLIAPSPILQKQYDADSPIETPFGEFESPRHAWFWFLVSLRPLTPWDRRSADRAEQWLTEHIPEFELDLEQILAWDGPVPPTVNRPTWIDGSDDEDLFMETEEVEDAE